MYFTSLSLFLLFFTSASNPVSETSLTLHPRYGWILCNVLNKPEIKKKDPTKVLVSYKYYLSPTNLSADTIEVESKKVVRQEKKANLTLQGKERSITPGLIVLGKDQKPYLVDAIFSNGKAAFLPLEINCASRFRTSKQSCFSPIKNTNHKIMQISDIHAVEQKCFLQSYCVGTTLDKINNIPLCSIYKINGKDVANHGVNCGKQKQTRINATFSDGTLLFNNKMLNLFPEATLKYQKIPLENPTTQ